MTDSAGNNSVLGDRWVYVGLLALLLWLPLPWGSNSDAARAFMTAAAALLLTAWLLRFAAGRIPRFELPLAARISVVLWLAWLAWLAVHVIPLPLDLVEWLSPRAADIHRHAGISDRATLSVNPTRSIAALITWGGYFALYLVALLCLRTGTRLRTTMVALAASGMAHGLYAIFMTTTGLEWGFLAEKVHNIGVATGTFVNRNHFAAYMALCMCAGIGLVLADIGGPAARNWKERIRQWVDLAFSAKMRIRVFLLVMVIALVLTRSRLGSVAFFTALCLCGLVYLLLRHRHLAGRGLIFFVSLLLVDLLVISEWFGLEELVERIEQTTLEREQRLAVLRDLPPLLERHVVVGTGPGTFVDVYEGVRSPHIRWRFDHAHNDYAQYWIETGLIGLLLLLGIALLHAWHALRVIALRRRAARAAAAFSAFMALTAMAIHGWGEFNMQIPALAGTLTVLMAMTAVSSARRSGERNGRRPPLGSAAQEGIK